MTQTPISPSLIGRITQAARYVISGVAPDAWFGPMQPLAPIAPPDVAGRRFDYPTGYNLNYNPRAQEPVSFPDLRALADSCDILRSVIETRKDQVEAQQWAVRVKQEGTSPKVPMATDDQKRRIDGVTNFLHCPDGQHGFDGWLRQILEDMFVIDAVAIYKRRNRAGGLFALEVIDAATIKILLDDSGRVPSPPDPGYQQILKGVPAADYTRDELMYLVHNPRSHKVYGYSHVEQVLVTVNILIRRSLHQLEYYREGSQPDAFVGMPKEWTIDQITDFQKYFDSLYAGNLAERRHVRFMPGDFHYQETKPPLLKDAYDEYLARIVCFVFSISPEAFVGQVNRATAETSQARAVDEGLAPLMRFVRNFLNRVIAQEFASPDLEFAWEETRAQDPMQAAQIDVAYVSAGILTVNEVRANLGMAPLSTNAANNASAPNDIQAENALKLQKKTSRLRKDDEEDEHDEDDSDDEDGDDSDESGSNFDDQHPRWPSGSPGGIGGEFAPKDSGDATGTLHDALAQDERSTAPLAPDSAWAALTSAIDKPSNLVDGMQVVGGNRDMFIGLLNEWKAEQAAETNAQEEAAAVGSAARQSRSSAQSTASVAQDAAANAGVVAAGDSAVIETQALANQSSNIIGPMQRFGDYDLVYGPSAYGALSSLVNENGGKLLSDVGTPYGGSWSALSTDVLAAAAETGTQVHFDLTNMLEIDDVLAGQGQYANTAPGVELRYIRNNWDSFVNKPKFYNSGWEVLAPWIK